MGRVSRFYVRCCPAGVPRGGAAGLCGRAPRVGREPSVLGREQLLHFDLRRGRGFNVGAHATQARPSPARARRAASGRRSLRRGEVRRHPPRGPYGAAGQRRVQDRRPRVHGGRGTKFNLFPGSGLFKRKPSWVVAAELVETTKLYARTAAAVKPEWVERLAGHLVARAYSEPHWQASSAHVIAFEKVTLYGLVLVPKRAVHFGPIDPKISRELFVHHAAGGRRVQDVRAVLHAQPGDDRRGGGVGGEAPPAGRAGRHAGAVRVLRRPRARGRSTTGRCSRNGGGRPSGRTPGCCSCPRPT